MKMTTATATMLCHLKAKPLAESELPPTNQPFTTACVTRKSQFDDRCAFVEDEGSLILMVFVQTEYRKKITPQLEKLYVDDAAELHNRSLNVQKLSLTTDLCTELTSEWKNLCIWCILSDGTQKT